MFERLRRRCLHLGTSVGKQPGVRVCDGGGEEEEEEGNYRGNCVSPHLHPTRPHRLALRECGTTE